MQIYSIGIDIIYVLIGLIVIYAGYKRGFLRSVILIIGYAASIVLAVILSRALSPWIFNTFMRNGIVKNVNEIIQNSMQSANITEVIGEFFDTLPKFFVNLINLTFGENTALAASIESSTNGMLESVGASIADIVVGPIVILLLQGILCILIFVVCICIVKAVSALFKTFDEVPILGKVNSFFGGVMGVGIAFIWLVLITIILKVTISMTTNNLSFLNEAVLEESFIFKWFYHLKFI